jgi:hypothetical protein
LDRDLKIGDVIPLADGQSVSKTALGYIKARKTRAATMAARSTVEGAAKNQLEARARLTEKLNADTKARLGDPYEQAKAFLQRKGYRVYTAKMCSPPRKGIVVGRQTFADEKAVRAYAQSLGWIPTKRA